jgi:hypothetical protein
VEHGFDSVLGSGRGRRWTNEKNQLLHEAVLIPYIPRALRLLSEAPKNETTQQHILALAHWLARIGRITYQHEHHQILEGLRLFTRHCKHVVRDYDNVLHVVINEHPLCAGVRNPQAALRGSYTDERLVRCGQCQQTAPLLDEMQEDYLLTGFSKESEKLWHELTWPLLLKEINVGIAHGNEERLVNSVRAAFGQTRKKALAHEMQSRSHELDWMVLGDFGVKYQCNVGKGGWQRNKMWSAARCKTISEMLLESQENVDARIGKARAHLTMATRLHGL